MVGAASASSSSSVPSFVPRRGNTSLTPSHLHAIRHTRAHVPTYKYIDCTRFTRENDETRLYLDAYVFRARVVSSAPLPPANPWSTRFRYDFVFTQLHPYVVIPLSHLASLYLRILRREISVFLLFFLQYAMFLASSRALKTSRLLRVKSVQG